MDINVVGLEQMVPSMSCACCHKPIDPRTAWKRSDNCFYCSEFCADSETAPITQCIQKEFLDHQYMERLRRLLPLMQNNQVRSH
jgi:hypothetical protein